MDQRCRECGSPDLETRVTLQHDNCGYIRPAEVFYTENGERSTCPQCDRSISSADLSFVGRFNHCPDCLQRYDTHKATPTSNTPESTPHPTQAPSHVVSGSLNQDQSDDPRSDPSRAVSKSRLWTGVLMTVGLLLVASLLAPFGPAPVDASGDGAVGDQGPMVGFTTGSGGPRDHGGDSDGFDRVSPTSQYTPPQPGVYETIVVFRNDDLQPKYRPAALQDVTELFLGEGVPITYSVLGNTQPDAAVCGYLQSLTQQHPQQFEIAVHGYSHENRLSADSPQQSEFAGLPVTKQAHLIANGTANVQDCIGNRPTTFVPPFDSYDNQTVSALNQQGYDTISGGTWTYGHPDAVFEQGGLMHVGYVTTQGLTQLYYNWTASPPRAHSLSELNQSFDRARQTHSLFLFTLHYQQFTNESERERLREFIAYQKSTDIAFMTVGQLAAAVNQGRLFQTDQGWRYEGPPTQQSAATGNTTPSNSWPAPLLTQSQSSTASNTTLRSLTATGSSTRPSTSLDGPGLSRSPVVYGELR
jgi:peptidoglycan/xylan/chitin deacetylase (PgdA/CDA1 family)